MDNITKQFLARIDLLSTQPMSNEVLHRSKQSLLDYLAVTAAGANFSEDKIYKYLAFAEPENGDYMAIGLGRKMALKDAVFLNGLNGHALDFDDGTNAGIIHLGSPIFSLLLPLSCKYGKTIEEMLRAAVIGYEVSFTMAISIQPGHKALGYHATGTCGVLGATIAASYLLDFTEEERANAFATACVSASGMLKVLDDGSELKPYNVAKTALLALTSLQLAKAGFKGHPDALSGYRGYFMMMTGKETIDLKPMLLNGTYAIQKSYTKPYAACRYLHPSIEAAMKIRKETNVCTEDIDSILIRTYSLAVSGHDHVEIYGSASAKMSIPYSVSIALVSGKAGLKEFDDEHVKDEIVLNLAKRVQVVADKDMSDIFPTEQSAKLSVILKNGREYSEQVDYPKGEPENPMSELEFRERFTDLLLYAGRTQSAIDKLYALIMGGAVSVNKMMELV
ncbi:MmgE/PrpD family protein [Desulfosporosinus nitroreducens]|uniref:MmgE/PrpD family protein n=1 Tax=Desulfosporosinus nitroreducens TaxID=2018668 RepID=A0ABT8QSH4_9FIRM|nr:MmgE/PrpD family protein [Desulfosporosinus nitroreducens]MDO0824286.1 MmgE/PrpD family protein [Desulfosporosinus nitroreducens]